MNKNKNLSIEENFKLAVTNHGQNKLKEAQILYNKILEINPNHLPSLNNLGTIFGKLGEHQKAKDSYEKLIEIDPKHINAHNNLGAIYANLKEYKKAVNCYEKAIEVNHNFANSHYNLGNIFKELGEHQKAKDCYEKVIEIDSKYLNAYINLGTICANLKEYQKAMDCFKEAIEINPNNAKAHFNLGTIYIDLDEYQKARFFLEKTIELNPNFARAHNNLGAIYTNLGEQQKAKSCYEKAIEIDPNYLNSHNNLGTILKELKENQKAINFFEKVIKIDPNNLRAHNNLGSLYVDLGEYQKAINYYDKAIKINTMDTGTIVNLAVFFKTIKFNNFSEEQVEHYKELFIILFRNNNISHTGLSSQIKLLFFSKFDENQLQQVITSKSSLLTNEFIQNFLKEKLLHLILQKSLIPVKFIEKLLTTLRSEILFTLDDLNKDILNEHFNFIISLAEQCWLNEYVYIDSEKEINQITKLKNKIENDNSVNEIEIAILGCYIPLNKSKIITEKLFNYKSTNILFNDLINVQIKEPLSEKELVKSIKSLDVIKDLTSKKVQEQYEEHPYPRWRYTNKYISCQTSLSINLDIQPNKIIYNDKFDNPNVLIAGCGTGNHSIAATQYKNASILGIDLSKSSLAYAKRKTNELGYKNIEYLHADILQLKKLDRKFDIIECGGTLHHMKDPITGLKVLLDILEPHGFLKLGLYSDTARQDVVKARDFIKERNFTNTINDIKDFRQGIINKKKDSLMEDVTIRNDFYSTSTVRDLLFHVQEHRFTIPEISKILKDLNLEFLGFFHSNPLIKIEYLKLFPNDKRCTSLDNWHQFEISNPETFRAMYQFWIKKNEISNFN